MSERDGNASEPSVAETTRRAIMKAFDLRQRPSGEALGGGLLGGYAGAALLGPLGALIGMPTGAALAKVAVELAERHDRIKKRGSSAQS